MGGQHSLPQQLNVLHQRPRVSVAQHNSKAVGIPGTDNVDTGPFSLGFSHGSKMGRLTRITLRLIQATPCC